MVMSLVRFAVLNLTFASSSFQIDVHIFEGPQISFLEVKGELSSEQLASAVTTTRSGNKVSIIYKTDSPFTPSN